ncbi:MAG: hypothetical protein V4488_06740 [Pseudomonadota bacterium]
MRPGTYYDIEFEIFGDEPTKLVLRLASEAEVFAFAKSKLQANSELFIACLGDGVDYGNLIIEVDSQGQAALTAHEHRGFFAKGMSMVEAINTLEYWLPAQSRTPEIPWVEQ